MKLGMILGQVLASKAVVDKVKIPARYYEKVDAGLKELESWAGVFREFDVEKPQTWVSSGLRALRRISEPGKPKRKQGSKSNIFRALALRGLYRLDNLNAVLFYDNIIEKYGHNSSIVSIGEHGSLRRISLEGDSFGGCPEDFFYYESKAGGQGENPSASGDNIMMALPFLPRYDNPETKERRVALNYALAQLFWADKKIIQLDLKNDIVEYTPVHSPPREYEGVLTRLYEDLRNYKEGGTRRSILFQGPPGTGKSTIVYNIAERLSARTVVVTHDFLTWVSQPQWEYIIAMLLPEMIIIDDIDRVADYMQRKLPLLEDRYCQVPLIIMTSNHYERLPDAFKRPGRIDEIIEMQTPGQSVRYEVIRALASQEGIEIPDEYMSILDEIHARYPGAYIVELLRRVRTLGWTYQIPPYDMTFRGLSPEILRKWNNLGAPPGGVVSMPQEDSCVRGEGAAEETRGEASPDHPTDMDEVLYGLWDNGDGIVNRLLDNNSDDDDFEW